MWKGDKPMKKYTMKDFDQEFPDDDACLEWVKNYRWPDGIHCIKCQKITKHHKVKNRPCYECDYCGNQVYPTADTIFHKSATPLRTWFQVIYRMASTRCGISAKQIERETGVTYKTAWRMFRQVRTLFEQDSPAFIGEVEVDETYVGAKKHGKRGRGAGGKSKVIGIAQREGRVLASVIPDVKRKTILPHILKQVNKKQVNKQAVLYTDEFPSYDTMTSIGFTHLRVRHHDKEYVRGRIHTNSIEGFWSLIKRGIAGVYHSVSPLYLQSYINEYAFRYNHGKSEMPMFKIFLSQIS
jgi:transposase